MVNWLTLTIPIPNCESTIPPTANCPMAMTPFATTGVLFARYLNETCTRGRPATVAFDLYSNP
jgi:hypothetical protein